MPQSVAAVATTAAAVAAWKSALASRRTSQDALAALAVSLRPHVSAEVTLRGTAGEDLRQVARAFNDSAWDALDVAIEVLLKDGTRLIDRHERLRPALTQSRERTGDEIAIDLIPAHEGFELEPASQCAQRVTVSYSDSRKIARYQHQQTIKGDPPRWVVTDDKISGP